jgi:hypothetical protein
MYGLTACEAGGGRFTTTQKEMNKTPLKTPLTVPKRLL